MLEMKVCRKYRTLSEAQHYANRIARSEGVANAAADLEAAGGVNAKAESVLGWPVVGKEIVSASALRLAAAANPSSAPPTSSRRENGLREVLVMGRLFACGPNA
jgi:hypothetical protein